MRTRLPRLGAALLAAYLALALTGTALHLGRAPLYGDSVEYLDLARTGDRDPHRGWLYPRLLAGALAITGEGRNAQAFQRDLAGAIRDRDRDRDRVRGEAPARRDPPRMPRALLGLQLLQLAVAGLCVAGFARALGLARGGPALGLLTLLVVCDPLVAHHQLALLTDGLALSASLAFCAALSALGRRPSRLAAPALALAAAAAAGLRPEKGWVLVGTALLTPLLWTASSRRGPGGLAPGWPARAALALALCVGAVGRTVAAERWGADPRRIRPPLLPVLLQQRVVFPHLASVYDELPARTRTRISRRDAERSDRHLNLARQVARGATRGDPEAFDRFARDAAGAVLRRHAPAIAFDVAKDAAENLLATLSFATRLAVWRWDPEARTRGWRLEATEWTFSRLARDRPGLSRAWLGASLALLSVAAPLALLRGRRERTATGPAARAAARAAWAPVLAFCALNAVAFAATVDLVSVRYGLVSHAVLLALVWGTLCGAPHSR